MQRFAACTDATDLKQFAADVQYYLTLDPRQLPSRYLYDALGSALFEAICRLPWYRITRAEERLLVRHGAEVLRAVRPSTIVELGSGSGEKLRLLLGADDVTAQPIDVHLVDVSSSALEASARALQSFSHVRVFPHQAAYEDGLSEALRDRPDDDRALVLFLGSNIGNYDPPGANALLCAVGGQLRTADALLLGADLVKSENVLRLAYDDPLGVTAAFNRNLLVRINRELAGDFDVTQFAHQVIWNAQAARIEMHLVARSAQQIHVRDADVAFTMRPGERIWTESSYKYRAEDVVRFLERARFRPMTQWVDRDDQFALTLVEH